MTTRQRTPATKASVLAAAGAAVSGGAWILPPGGVPAAGAQTAPAEWQPTVTVTGEGDCDTLQVEVSGAVPDGYDAYAFGVDYTITSDCYVQLGDPTVGPDDTPEDTPLEASNAATGSGTEDTPETWYGNYIHSSQTMQDVVNIDIAKFRYDHDRVWNGSQTYFKSCCGYARSSTSVSWNHPAGSPVFDGWDGAPVATAHGYAHGDFHSDFLWCNFQAGQNFRMNTTLDSFKTGGYDAHFGQNRACGGTHMATSKSANTNPPSWL